MNKIKENWVDSSFNRLKGKIIIDMTISKNEIIFYTSESKKFKLEGESWCDILLSSLLHFELQGTILNSPIIEATQQETEMGLEYYEEGGMPINFTHYNFKIKTDTGEFSILWKTQQGFSHTSYLTFMEDTNSD